MCVRALCRSIDRCFVLEMPSTPHGQGQSNHQTAHDKLISIIAAAAPALDECSPFGKDDEGTDVPLIVPLIVARKLRAVSPSSNVVGPALGSSLVVGDSDGGADGALVGSCDGTVEGTKLGFWDGSPDGC